MRHLFFKCQLVGLECASRPVQQCDIVVRDGVEERAQLGLERQRERSRRIRAHVLGAQTVELLLRVRQHVFAHAAEEPNRVGRKLLLRTAGVRV